MREIVTRSGYIVAERPISAEKLAKGQRLESEERDRQEAASTTRKAIRDARPPDEVLSKVRDGRAITAAERDAVLRYLTLKLM